ncbi:MAG: hypothetical protein F8N36_15325 [Desulfovibrio sp.]|uniref:hypothetical protein n=1 Tax=Desulfovibrio sp. TaxID=885 RepID=UPI00135E4DD3|nr:hypothetical protein [Desulfovibrio sp.]MTJ94212.1 hypothetical protein [Desulfovibrio sp.]
MTDELQDRLDAHHLWQMERALRECHAPEMVRIVDTGQPGAGDRPRYRFEMVDQAPPAPAAI